MLFSVNLRAFHNLLQKVYPVVPTRTPYMVLYNLKFVTSGGCLKVYATDMDTSVMASITIESEEESKFVVNAKKIYDWTTISVSGDDQDVSIDVSDSNVVLTRGKSRSTFACVDVNDYPEFPNFEKNKSYDFPSDKLKYISSNVSNFAAQKDTARSRGALEGVLFDCSKDKFTSVATDANKLSVVSYDSALGFDGDVSVIIHPKPLNEVAKIVEISGYQGIKFSFSESSISFFSDDFELVTKLLDGPYPDYKKVIPSSYKICFSIDRQEILNALKITACLADDQNSLTKFYLENNELRLYSEDIKTNSKSDEFLSVDYSYESFVIGFNSLYLIEILSSMETQKVQFEFTEKNVGSLVRPLYAEEEKTKDILFLLMPLRINE